MTRLLHIFAVLLVWMGCSRETPSSSHGSASSDDAPVKASAKATEKEAELSPPHLSELISRPGATRIIALGDLHGDLDATRKALKLAKAIDDEDRWVGGDLVVVQTGDEIDRGDDDRAVLDLLERLKKEARSSGGAVYPLSGNHELMNVEGDFRYVTPGSLSSFVSDGGRNAAFHPGGSYAKMLADRPIVMRIGETVFVHGGILEKHVRYGLDLMVSEVSAFMRGERPAPPAVVSASDGPIWTRAYSQPGTEPPCAELSRVLKALNAKRMVVGHSVQPNGINAACDQQVWRIDVGMSKFYGGRPEVLEIQGDSVKALH